MIQVAKSSPVIVSNVSAQEISRTQDTNAGEVILEPDLLVGAYGEYRSLEYQTRNFINSVALGWPIGLIVDGEKGETVKDAKPSSLQSRATSILIHGHHW